MIKNPSKSNQNQNPNKPISKTSKSARSNPKSSVSSKNVEIGSGSNINQDMWKFNFIVYILLIKIFNFLLFFSKKCLEFIISFYLLLLSLYMIHRVKIVKIGNKLV